MKQVIIMDKNGLHARPASEIVSLAKNFPGEVFLQKNGVKCNAKSIMLVMGMNLKCGDMVEVIALGDGAYEIEAAIEAAIKKTDEE
jgi:phosphotransferase system HPr (HPr) family protein